MSSNKESEADKLVSSIRKAKSGAAATGRSAGKAAVKPKRPAATKKKATRKKATRKKVASASKSAGGAGGKQALIDLFQSGRRVWPD